MENTQDESLKKVIAQSQSGFTSLGITDQESINQWIGQSLYQLYNEGTGSGFLGNTDSLSGISKSQVLDFLINNYVEKIKDTEDASVRDEFQTIIKRETLRDEESLKSSLRKYVESRSLEGFQESDKSEITKYDPSGLIQAMSIVTVNRVLGDSIPNYDNETSKRNKIPVSDLYVISDNADRTITPDNIDGLMALMETIRSGAKEQKGPEEYNK